MNKNEPYFISDDNLHVSISKLEPYFNPYGVHFHKEIELVWVERGDIKCEFENEILDLPVNSILVINSLCNHQLLCNCNDSIVTYSQIDLTKYLNFLYQQENRFLTSFMRAKKEKQYEIFPSNSAPHKFITTCFDLINEKNPFYDAALSGCIFELIQAMGNVKMINADPQVLNTQGFDEIMPIIEYIENHLSEQISLNDLSAVMFLDRSNVCKKFKRITGKTISSYIKFRRIEWAKSQLISSKKDINSISQQCGFKSADYFNRIFKASEKCTATQYRKMYHVI